MNTLESVLSEYEKLAGKQASDYIKKTIPNARSSPVQIDQNETKAIALLVNLSAKLTPEKIDCRDSAAKALKDAKFLKSTVECIQGVISHSIKFSDAKYSGGVLAYPQRNSAKNSHYVSSATTRFLKPFDWCGNSADLSKKILFCTAFRWQNRVLTLAEAVAERIPVFITALTELGLSEEQIDDIAKKSQIALQPRVPDGKSYKTLYFPRRSSGKTNDYLLVTPVPSVAMQREIQRRTQKEALPEGVYIRTRRHKVGETKPLNVGDFYGSLTGHVTMLDGGFFNAKTPRHERALARFLAGHAYWGSLPKSDPKAGKDRKDADPFFFLTPITGSQYPKAHEHNQMRGGFKSLLINYLLAPHLEWAKLADSGELTFSSASGSPIHYFVFGRLRDETAKQRCIDAIAKQVASLAHDRGRTLSKAHIEALYEAIDEVITLRFNPETPHEH